MKQIISVVSLICLIFTIASPVSAHSEDAVIQISDASVGPYLVSVWMFPGVLRVGNSHFTVAVSEAEGEAVSDAQVKIRLDRMDATAPSTISRATAVGDNALSTQYEADLQVPDAGQYQVTVLVEDSSGQGGEVSFESEAFSATGFQFIITILLILSFLFGGWLLKEGFKVWGWKGVGAHQKNQTDLEKLRKKRMSSSG